MPYGPVHMTICWNGLSISTKGWSVHMPIVINNFKVRGVKKDSVSYMMKVILTYIPINPFVMSGLMRPLPVLLLDMSGLKLRPSCIYFP